MILTLFYRAFECFKSHKLLINNEYMYLNISKNIYKFIKVYSFTIFFMVPLLS